MNGKLYLTEEDRAVVQKWGWRVAIFYSAIVVLALVLGAVTTPKQRTAATVDRSVGQSLDRHARAQGEASPNLAEASAP
jgi:hypothetical protein